MNLSKIMLSALLCTATLTATPMSNTLTAGLFTFSDITVSGPGSADVTWSASTQSTSEYGGISSITFSDNGANAGTSGSLQFQYDVSYSGTDPRTGYSPGYYLASFAETYGFLGQEIGFTSLSCLANTCQGGVALAPTLNGYTGEVYNFGQGFTSFEVSEVIDLNQLAFAPPSGQFTTTFAAVDTPEPTSLGLYTVSFGALLIGALRRSGVRREPI